MFNKRFFYKSFPYAVSFLAGIGFYCLGLITSGDLKNLLMNVSASLIAIPVILFFYELIKNMFDGKLNKEIFEYGKMQVDREVMGIVNQLMKIVYPLEVVDKSLDGFSKFLSLPKENIRNLLTTNEYFGFQIFRTWSAYEANLENILNNSLIIQKLDNDQIIAIIKILKNLRSLDEIQKVNGMFVATGKKETKYKLVKGDKINPENTKYPDRFLLLKHISEDKFQVIDFPDIPKYNEDKAFYTYDLNKEGVDYFTGDVFDLITELNNWVSITGNEFLIDTKMFRLEYKTIKA